MPPTNAFRSPGPGLRLAQLAAVGMILGGGFDLSIRELMPHHETFLRVSTGGAPPETASLVLLILNILGVALVVVGGLALVLLRIWEREGIGWAGWAAALGITLASGANALAIHHVGSLFFLGPALFPLLALVGVAWGEGRRKQRA